MPKRDRVWDENLPRMGFKNLSKDRVIQKEQGPFLLFPDQY